MPFAIDRAGRDVWVACFERTLARAVDAYAFPPEHLDGFLAFLRGFSMWMVNSAPPQGK